MLIKNIQTENYDHENFDGPMVIELNISDETKADILETAKMAALLKLPGAHICFPSSVVEDGGATISVFPESFSVEIYPYSGEVYWTEEIPFESFEKQRFLLASAGNLEEPSEWEEGEDLDEYGVIHAYNLEEAIAIYVKMSRELHEEEYGDEE